MTEIYLKQIARLQEQNRLLAEVIADERRLRQRAWEVYWDRCSSRLFGAIHMIATLADGERKARAKFFRDAG